MSAYSDWAEKTLVEEEGVGPTGFYGIYRDSVRDPEKAPIGYPTTGNGVRLTEVETERFGGVGAQVPKEWLDRESKKRSLAAWNSASEYMKNSGIPDHPGAKEALASMAYQLGTKWHEDHKLTDKALKEGRYGDAAREVWRSKWAGQTPSRVRTASDAFARLGGSDPLPPQKLRTGKHRGKYASTGAGDIYSAAMSGDVVAREMMGELLDPQEDEGGGVPGAVTRGDDPAPGVLDYSSISSSVSEILNRKDPQSEAVYRDLLLPSGVVAEVHSGVTDEEATRRLRKSNPEYFVAPEPRAPSDGDSNVFEAFGAGAVRSSMGLWPGARAFFASLTGDEEAYDEAQAELAEISEQARSIAPDLVTTDEIGKVYDEEGLFPAVAKSIEFGAEQIFSSFGFQAPALAMAAVAGGAAAALAPAAVAGVAATGLSAVSAATVAMAAGAGMMFANYLSENIERGYEEGKLDTKDVEILKLVTASGGQAALDSLSYMLAGGTALLSAGGKRAFWSSTSKFLDELEKLSPIKRMLAVIAEEEVAEVGQQALERWSAGLTVSPTDEEAASEYIQIMLATLAPSMGFSGMGSVSSSWTKAKARRAENGIKKVGGELVQSVRGITSMKNDEEGRVIEEKAAEVESQRSELADRTREEGAATVRDVHNILKDRNIAYDDDSGFMSFTKRLVGQYHLDNMSPAKLGVVYDRISAMPVQDVQTSLQIAPDDKARSLARHKKFRGKTPVTISSIKSALGMDATISEEAADGIAQGYIDKMTRLGLVRVNSKGNTVVARVSPGVKPDVYNKIIARVRETGSFPTRLEMQEEFDVRNSKSYDSILEKALSQGEVQEFGKKYIAKPLTVGSSGGFRIEVDGVVQGPVYETEADAEIAADAEYDANNRSWDNNRRLNERLRVPESMRPVRKVGDVRIVEESGVRGSDVVDKFGYKVERAEGKGGKGGRGGRWVVRDLAGNIIKHFKSSAEAKAFKGRRDKNAYHYEVEIDGEVISQHKTEREASRAMQQWRNDEAASIEADILSEVPSGTGVSVAESKRLSEDAEQRASASARNSARRRKLKKRKVPEDSNLNEPSLEDGFVVLEDRIGEDGKKSSAPVGFYETESEALQASRDLGNKRVGRESFAGRIARKGSAKASEEMKAKRADPEAWAAGQIPLPPVTDESQLEWIAKLQNKLEEILRDRGLSEFRVNLVDGLDLSKDGSVGARFIASSNTLKLALGAKLEGMKLDDQVNELAPYLRHETLHGLRRLALIKPGEWLHLNKWVEKTRIPKFRLDMLNEGRADPFPEGTTYFQYAQIVYQGEGTRVVEKAALQESRDRGGISEEEFKVELAKIEESEWIPDDYYEEAVAAAIEDWPSIKPGDPKPGRVRAILRKIARVIRRIGSALNGMGFNTQQDVIELVYGGNFAERIARDKAFDVWYTRRGRGSEKAALFEAGAEADIELRRLRAAEESRKAREKAIEGGATPEEAEAAGAAASEGVEGSELNPEALDALDATGSRSALRPQAVVQDDGVHEAIDQDGVSYISRPRKDFSEYKEDHPGMLSHEEWVSSEKVKNKNIADKGGALGLFDLTPGSLVDARLDLTNLLPIEGETIPNSLGEQVPLKGFIAQVHDMKPGDGGRHSIDGRDAKQSGRGPGIAYYPVIVLDNATFETDSVGQQRIAKGKSQKFPHSSVRGEVSPMRVDEVDYSGLEVTYNPRDSHLYVTVDGRKLAVKSAERAVIADGNQNPDAPAGKLIPQNARVILQGKVEFWKESEAPSLPDGAVESKAEFFDSISSRSAKIPPVPASVDAASSLDGASELALGKQWRTGRDLKGALQERVLAAAEEAGVDLSLDNEETHEYLVRVGVQDALNALNQNANAVGWYDLKTRQALAVVSLVHPEVVKDPDSRFAFVYILATTSNGLEVGINFRQAEKVYRAYKEAGSMPTDMGIGEAADAVNKTLQLFNDLVGSWGVKNLRDFMLTDMTVGEIGRVEPSLKPGGEHVATQVRGAAIIGPKIGNGFFSNLYGMFDQLTMDRWLVRTWGRWTGTLLKVQPEQTQRAFERLRSAAEAVSPEDIKTMEELLKSVGVPPVYPDAAAKIQDSDAWLAELALAIQKVSMKPENRRRMNQTGAGAELRKAGNSLAGYLDAQKEDPSGPTERNRIRRVFGSMLAELQKDPKYADLTMADLQAVLWYSEKRLYETAKDSLSDGTTAGYGDTDAPDYANAAVALVQSLGVKDSRIRRALKGEESGRARAARPRASEREGVEGQPQEGRGFTPGEKKRFLGGLATLNARSNRGGGSAVWGYSRRTRRVRGGDGLLEWVPGKSLRRIYKSAGVVAPTFVELESTPENASRFAAAIEASRGGNKYGAAVYVYDPEEYQGMRLLLSESGKSGVAVKPDGDIVSLFSSEGAGRSVVEVAIAAGGTKADAFDTVLPHLYSAHGLMVVSRLKWDDSEAPVGWDKDTFRRFNNGEPDVVFMVVDPDYVSLYLGTEGVRSKSYDSALSAQKKAMRAVVKAAPAPGKIATNPEQLLGRSARRHGRGSFEQDRAARGADRSKPSPRRDRRWAAAIVRAQRPVVELPHDIYAVVDKPGDKNNPSWGWLHWDAKGKKPKSGRPTMAVVTRGYHQKTGIYNGVKANKTGIGERHAEFHDADLQRHTPYDSWRDMLSDFFRVVAASNKNLSTGYIYPSIRGRDATFLWDDPGFGHPITVVFSGELIGNTEVFMFVTAYPSERYDTYSGSRAQARAETPVHGPSVDAKSLKGYLRPAVAKAFQEKYKNRPGNRNSIIPGRGAKSPEVIRMGDRLWGNSRRDGRTFWNHISSGWDYFNSEEWWDGIRSQYLDKYRAIYRQGKRVGLKKMDSTLGMLADTSAHAAALMSDRAGGFLSAAFKYGIITYKDGIALVEDLKLENTVMGTFYDPVNNILVKREVTHKVYDEGETGGLIPILNPASSPENNLVDELFIYSAALRSFRLKTERGIDPPMSMEDILAGLELVNKHPELAVIHANMQKWNNGTVEFLIATGVIDRKMGDVWMESADYLPFFLNLENETTGMQQKIIESVLGDKVDYMMIGSLVGARPPKKISGMSAKQKIVEPIEAISLNTMAAITAGLNNVAVQRSVRDSLLLGNNQAVEVDKPGDEDVITVRISGEERFFRLADPLLHHALVGTLEGSNPLIDMLGGPARMLREVVTRSPEFMVANMLRDSLSVWAINGGEMIPVVDTFKQFGKNLNRWRVSDVSPEYKKLEMGGAIGGYDLGGTTPRHLQRFFARKVRGDKGTFAPVKKVWDALGEVSAISESSTREVVYNQTYDRVLGDLLASGMDVETASRKAQGEASFQAMEVLNFSRRGNSVWLKFVTATVPFLNARLQGMDVMARTMKGEHSQLPGSRDRILTSIAARAALLSSFTLLYAVLMHDDEDYQNLRPEVKDDYWNLPIFPDGGFLSIPIPFEAGVLFKVLPQKMAELMLGGTTRDARNSIRHAAISTLNFNPIPQAVKPILEVMTNHNFFTGRPLIPFYMENMEDAYQKRDSTTSVASMLGGEVAQAVTLGMSPSPIEWENLLRGYFGGMGMMTASILDSVFKTITPGIPGKPWPRATDMIFAGRFYRDEFGGGLKSGYYELRNEINGIVTTVNSMAKTDPAKAARYRAENSSVLMLKSTIQAVDKRMKDFRERKSRITLSDMDGARKRELLDSLERSENNLLRIVPSLRRAAYMNIEY